MAQQGQAGLVERLDELFAQWDSATAPGLVVGVARDGATLYRRGFGMASLEAGARLTAQTRMRIGSTSKHFACALALLLAEDGALDIDAPIRRYVPEVVGPGGDPTLRQLMQHRGGSRCHLDIGSICHGSALPELGVALQTQVRQRDRNFEPGEAVIYNNGGYHLLSLAIERAGGAPFEEQLRQRLFAPLGMNDTASVPSDYEITPGIATMHVPMPDGRWARGLFPSQELRGEGAIVSTLADMLRWMAHLRNPDRLGSPDLWRTLLAAPQGLRDEAGVYGLGLMHQRYRGLPIVHHAGGVAGGSSQMLMAPGVDVMIIANGAPGAVPTGLAERVLDIVLADDLAPAEPSLSPADYGALLGDWWSAQTGMIYGLADHGGQLKLEITKFSVGFALRAEPGRLIAPETHIGQVAIGLPAAGAAELAISFGGRTAAYRRLDPQAVDRAAFAAAAAGRYYSADADATAIISLREGQLTIAFADAHGGIEVELVCAGETVAFTHSSHPKQLHCAALSFAPSGEHMAGFHINSMRTRGLWFEWI